MEAFHHPPISFHFPYDFPIPTPTTNFLGTPNSSSINGMIINTWMYSRIWSRLPHRLIDRIIAFLPPPAFLELELFVRDSMDLFTLHIFLNCTCKFHLRGTGSFSLNKKYQETTFTRT